MAKQIKFRCSEDFYKTFRSVDVHAKAGMLNQEYILREAQDGLRLVECLRSYWEFLSNTREYKAKSGGSSTAFEREVLAQARKALEDMRTLLAKALRITKHLKNGGMVDQLLETWTASVKAAGKVRLQDVWLDVLDIKDVREVFEQAGISQATIKAFTDNMRELEQVHEVKQGRLTVQTGRHDREIVIARRPPAGRAKSVDDLLFGNQFDAVVEVFHQPGSLFADVVPVSQDQAGEVVLLDPLETLLAGATLSVREVAYHVRRLEDTGDNPAIIPFILIGVAVAAGAAILVGGTMLILCAAEVITDDTACTIGGILLTMGIVLLVGAVDCLLEGCEIVLQLIISGIAVPIIGVQVEGIT